MNEQQWRKQQIIDIRNQRSGAEHSRFVRDQDTFERHFWKAWWIMLGLLVLFWGLIAWGIIMLVHSIATK